MSATPRTPFVWPPQTAPLAPKKSSSPTQRAPEPKTPSGWWAAIERAWLDPVAEPLVRRAAAAGWSRDELDVFCNRCGHDIGAYESDEFGCMRCRDERLPWDRCIRLGEYRAPLSEWVCEVKFTRWRVLGLSLGRLLAQRIRDLGIPAGAEVIVVPIPTTWRRRVSRGIDHAGVIAQGVASELKLPLVRALRRRHRPSQRAVPLSERASNVAKAFTCPRPDLLAGKTILLIDDVMTTGATMRAAARALRDPRRKPSPDLPDAIWACALAVTPEPGRLAIPTMPAGSPAFI